MKKISVKNVSKIINDTDILKNINIEFEEGKIYGIYGHNGSGKTMFFRTLCGLIKPSNGTIEINGDILHKDIDFPKSIGVLIENPSFWRDYTGIEVLETLAKIKDIASKDDIINALNRVGLDYKDKRVLRKYSLGMKQRLGIAQAIMEDQKIIILDEPFNGLDKNGCNQIKNLLMELKSPDRLILLTSHIEGDIDSLSDYIFEFSDGMISLVK